MHTICDLAKLPVLEWGFNLEGGGDYWSNGPNTPAGEISNLFVIYPSEFYKNIAPHHYEELCKAEPQKEFMMFAFFQKVGADVVCYPIGSDPDWIFTGSLEECKEYACKEIQKN